MRALRPDRGADDRLGDAAPCRSTAPEADRLRAHYWATYGTTLAGLMTEHGVDPGPYLTDVHDIDFSRPGPRPGLAAAHRAPCPAARSSTPTAARPMPKRCLRRAGLGGPVRCGLRRGTCGLPPQARRPRPSRRSSRRTASTPTRAAMFEDDTRNLAVPHALGMRTVHVAPDARTRAHIHHHTDDLAGFLARLAGVTERHMPLTFRACAPYLAAQPR